MEINYNTIPESSPQIVNQRLKLSHWSVFSKFSFLAFLAFVLLNLNSLILVPSYISIFLNPYIILIFLFIIEIFGLSGLFYQKNLGSSNKAMFGLTLFLLPAANFIVIYVIAFLTESLLRSQEFYFFNFAAVPYRLLLDSLFKITVPATIFVSLLSIWKRLRTNIEYTNFNFLFIFISLIIVPVSLNLYQIARTYSFTQKTSELKEAAQAIMIKSQDLPRQKDYSGGYYVGELEAISPSKKYSLKVLMKDDRHLAELLRFQLTDLSSKNDKEISFLGEKIINTSYDDVYLKTTFDWIDDENILVYQHNLPEFEEPIHFIYNIGFTVWRFNIKTNTQQKLWHAQKVSEQSAVKFASSAKQLRYISGNDFISLDLATGKSDKISFSGFESCRDLIWSNLGDKALCEYRVGQPNDYLENIDIIDFNTKTRTKMLENISSSILYGVVSYNVWSPMDTKLKFGDFIYNLNQNKKIELKDLYKELNAGGGTIPWYDDDSILSDSNIGKILINVVNLSYKKVIVQ